MSVQVGVSELVLLFSNAHCCMAASIIQRLLMQVLLWLGPLCSGLGNPTPITIAIVRMTKMKAMLTRPFIFGLSCLITN